MEKDPSLVDLLKVLDPKSLDESGSVNEQETSTVLSKRGVVGLGVGSAALWYCLRLVLRDVWGRLYSRATAGRQLVELQVLSSLHALGWAVFVFRKLLGPPQEMARNCQRALLL